MSKNKPIAIELGIFRDQASSIPIIGGIISAVVGLEKLALFIMSHGIQRLPLAQKIRDSRIANQGVFADDCGHILFMEELEGLPYEDGGEVKSEIPELWDEFHHPSPKGKVWH